MWHRLSLTLVTLLLPLQTLAYRVPERDYWRAYNLHFINASRAESGLPPLGLEAELTDLAQVHAEDTAVHYDDSSAEARRSSYLMHRSFDRRELPDRVRGRRITGATQFGENVGLRYNSSFTDVYRSIEEAITFLHTYMMNEVPPDDGHKQTLLGDYTHVGIGLELHRSAGSERNTLFLVQDFAHFTDGRAVVIPDLGPRPEWRAPAPLPTHVKERPQPSARRLRRAQRALPTKRQGSTVIPPLRVTPSRHRPLERETIIPSKRTATGILKNILNRREERRQLRMMQRGRSLR